LLFTVITLDLIWFQMNNANHGVEGKKTPHSIGGVGKKTSQKNISSPRA